VWECEWEERMKVEREGKSGEDETNRQCPVYSSNCQESVKYVE